jgi:ribulose-phosphate 3-epimerase
VIHIYPALMGANYNEYKKLDQLDGLVDRVHIDIMDGAFVSYKTTGADELNNYIKKTKFLLWIHAMVEFPECFYQELVLPQGTLFSFHLESNGDFLNLIKLIKEKKHRASIALNPKTPISEAIPFLGIVDQVLVMSVDPGASGQPFLKEVIKKIEDFVLYRQQHDLAFRIAVDGGVNKENISLLAQMGVDDCAISSGIFNQKDPGQALRALHRLVED